MRRTFARPKNPRSGYLRRLAGRMLLAALVAVGVALPARTAQAEGGRALAREAYRAVQAGDSVEARRLVDEAVAAEPNNPLVWRVHGYVLNNLGEARAAFGSYQEALRLDPRDAIAHNNIGIILLSLGDHRQALKAFDTALRDRPDYADARNNRGVALERLGRGREAERSYRYAARSNPRLAQAHNNLGALQLKRGDTSAAAQAFTEALAANPALAAPRLNLAILQVGGTPDEGDLEALEALAAGPEASDDLRVQAWAARARWHGGRGEHEVAHGLYMQALALRPDDASLLNNTAVTEDQLGRDRDAVLHLTAALEAQPDLYVARNNIGIVHVHRGDLDTAESTFRELLQASPRFHRAHYNLAVILAARGNVRGALRRFETARRLAPRDADTLYNLAMLRRRAGGSPQGERRDYQAALRLDPDLAEAHLALGTLMADPATPRGTRDPARARHHLRRFLELARETDEEGRMQAEAWLSWLSRPRRR